MEAISYRGVLPPLIIREDTYTKIDDIYDTLLLLLGYIIENRKKRGLFGKEEEKINYVIPLYYPIYIAEVGLGKALLFDPFSTEKQEVTIIEPYIDLLVSYVNKIEDALSKGNDEEAIATIKKLDNIVNDIILKNKYVIKNKIKIYRVSSNRAFIRDVMVLLDYMVNQWFNGIIIPNDITQLKRAEIDIIRTKNKISAVLKKFSTTLNKINDIVLKLDRIEPQLSMLISKKYAEKIEERNRFLSSIKDKVDARIRLLHDRFERELSRLEENYRQMMTPIMNKLRDLSRKIDDDTYSREIEVKESRYLRKLAKEIDKERRLLSSKLKILEEKKEKEKEQISRQYKKLIEVELKKIDLIEQEITDLERKRDETISSIKYIINNIRNNIVSINDNLAKYINIISRNLVSAPLSGDGFYLIPLHIVEYSTSKKRRIYIVPPLYLDIKGYSRPKYIEFDTIYSSISSTIKKYHNIVKESDALSRYNVLDKLPRDIVFDRLQKLLNSKYIDKKLYEEIKNFIIRIRGPRRGLKSF